MQRLNPFCLLPLAQTIRRRYLKERGRRIYQPLGFYSRCTVHIFFRGQPQCVKYHVLGRLAKHGATGVHVHGGAFYQSFVAFLRILARGVPEEP